MCLKDICFLIAFAQSEIFPPNFNVNSDFIGVTGNKHLIRRFTAEINVAYNKVPLEGEDYTVDHSTQIVLINPKGDYHGFFRGPHSEIMVRQTWRSIYASFN